MRSAIDMLLKLWFTVQSYLTKIASKALVSTTAFTIATTDALAFATATFATATFAIATTYALAFATIAAFAFAIATTYALAFATTALAFATTAAFTTWGT